jgi:hypothetical protein
MSGSPVVTLRRIQEAVKSAGGQDITTLDLSRCLIAQMGETGSLRLDLVSLKVHHDRLLNWQIADRLIMGAPPGDEDEPGRLSQAKLADLYSAYTAQAEAAGLVPMAYATFRLRAYAAPTSNRRRRVIRVL